MDYCCCCYWPDNKPVATFETSFAVGWPVVTANADGFENFALILGVPLSVDDDCGYDYGYGYGCGYGCDCDYDSDLDYDVAIEFVGPQPTNTMMFG